MKIRYLCAVVISGLLFNLSHAQTVDMTILSNPAAINSYPGNDGLVGNGDDVVSSQTTTNNGSGPNTSGSYGYNAFNFGGASNENELPTGFNAITFVNGNVTIDQGVFNNGGGAIVTALDITSGTEPFPGHGAYSATATSINSGTYNPGSQQFTLDVDISFLINGNTSTEPGLVLSGTAIMLESSEFTTGSGNAYVDQVLVPLAQASDADSLAYFDGTGMLPNLGFPIRFVIVAVEGGSGGFTINQGISGSWFNPETAGQGFLIDVDPENNFIFIAWFTYDDEGNRIKVGSDDQRWLTAQGNYSGGSASISIFDTSGGRFNDPQPTDTDLEGTMNISFSSCSSGSVQFNLPDDGLSGTIPIQRLLPATSALCDTLGAPAALDR